MKGRRRPRPFLVDPILGATPFCFSEVRSERGGPCPHMSYFACVTECRSVNCYDKIELRGEGTYGQVWAARAFSMGPMLLLGLSLLNCASPRNLLMTIGCGWG